MGRGSKRSFGADDGASACGFDAQATPRTGGGSGPCLDGILEINVGGRVFSTRRSTLAAVKGSRLGELFGERSAAFETAERDADGRVFLDRDGDSFAHVLDYLRRAGQLVGEYSADTLARLRQDAEHYGLAGLVEEVDSAENQMRTCKVYEYQHMMYGPLIAVDGTPYDTNEKALAEREKRDADLAARSKQGWTIDKMTVDSHGVWLDMFLAKKTGRIAPSSEHAVVLHSRPQQQQPPPQQQHRPASGGPRRRTTYGARCSPPVRSGGPTDGWRAGPVRFRPKGGGHDRTPKRVRPVPQQRDAVSAAAAAELAEREAAALAQAEAPARGLRGPLPTVCEHRSLRPEVVYDLIADLNPCQGRRPDFITDADVGKIYIERMQGVPGIARKDRRQRGLQKWSQGDTLWTKQVPQVRYGPEGRGQVWVKAVYGQVLPAAWQGKKVKAAKAAALAAQAQLAKHAAEAEGATPEAAAAATAMAAAAAAEAAANNLPLASFSYHMYEVHWYNEGLPEGAQLGGRQSLNYDRADWCVRLSLSPPPPVCCAPWYR
jgi:hypothetical protein